MVCLSSISTDWLEDEASTITVAGTYLPALGFPVGQKVVVEVTQGLITIKAIDAEE